MGTAKVVGLTYDAFDRALLNQEVELELKNFSAVRTGPFANTEPETFKLKGRVMRRPRGHERDFDCFGFAVPFTEVPMRVVAMRHVLAVNGTPVLHPKAKKPAGRSWQVNSSRSDEKYTVSEKNGVWACTCVANSNFRKICRHIKDMKEQHG